MARAASNALSLASLFALLFVLAASASPADAPRPPALLASVQAAHRRDLGRVTWRLDGHAVSTRRASQFSAAPPPSQALGGGEVPSPCLIPSGDALFSLQQLTGARLHDLGDYDGCLAAGYGYCLLQVGGDGGMPVGVCLPKTCELELLNCNISTCLSSTVGKYIASVAPIVAIYELYGVPIMGTCGDGAHTTWPAGAVLTVGLLVALACAVAAATVYTTGSTAAPAGGALAACARRTSLAATLPPLLSAAPRRQRPGSADLGAMDAVRVLSTACVVLGHSVYFLTSGPGFINSDTLQDAVFSAAGQVIPSAEFAVDSFFLLSGCLGTYLFVREVVAALPEWAANAPPGHSDKALLAGCFRRSGAGSGGGGGGWGAKLLSGEEGQEGDEAAAGEAAAATLPPSSSRRTAVTLAALYASLVAHRFLRLAPALFIMMCVMYYVLPLVSSGPWWFKYDEFIQPCSGKYFWRTVFFLFNIDTDTQCAGWAWYLAVDFQLYATVLPLLVFFYAWRPAAGWLALAVTLATSLAVSVWVVVNKSLSSTLDANGQLEALGLTGDTFTFFYTRPWTRAPAFICGVALGFALLSYERVLAGGGSGGSGSGDGGSGGGGGDTAGDAAGTGGDRDMGDKDPADKAAGAGSLAAYARAVALAVLPSRPPASAGGPRRLDWAATASHAAALAVLGALWYAPAVNFAAARASTPPGGWSSAGMQAYTALSRPGWAAALAVVLYLCATGRGGALHAALAHPLWRPYCRLSYCAYLLHPLVLFAVNFSATSEVRFSPVAIAVVYTANLVIVCASAAVMHVIVEAPIAAAEKAVMGAVARRLRGSKARV